MHQSGVCSHHSVGRIHLGDMIAQDVPLRGHPDGGEGDHQVGERGGEVGVGQLEVPELGPEAGVDDLLVCGEEVEEGLHSGVVQRLLQLQQVPQKLPDLLSFCKET